VVTLWNKKAAFPVSFVKIEGFTDETAGYCDQLNYFTPVVHDIFFHLSTNSTSILVIMFLLDFYLMEKDLKELLLGLGPRGFMTMLGFRKTTGSQDLPWPSKSDLILNFNKPHIVLCKYRISKKFLIHLLQLRRN
jgi:hypothetical protein